MDVHTAKQLTSQRSIFDWLLFFSSAMGCAGVIFGMWKYINWVTVTGYMLALFWMLSCWGFRGALLAQKEYIDKLENAMGTLLAKIKKDEEKNK